MTASGLKLPPQTDLGDGGHSENTAIFTISIQANQQNDREDAILHGPRQANLVLIAYASSEGSSEPAHPCSLARTSAARSYKQ